MRSAAFAAALSLALGGCVAQTLAPGPGPAEPQFLDAGHWRASDGFVLGMSAWPVEGARTVVVALHGMNDYGQFIEGAAKHWQQRGIVTYAFDQRGFGRTEGNGRWAGHETMTHDARTFLSLVRARHAGARIFLLGTSMGGAVAMLTAAGDAPPADGLVLVSPALWGWSNLDLFKRAGLWAMRQIAPGGRLSGRGLDIRPSDNDAVLMAMGRDPFVIKSTRVDALSGLVDLMEAAWVKRTEVRLPTMVLYAEGDEVVPAGPIAEAARDMPGVRLVACFGNGFHMLLRDLEGKARWEIIEGFLRDGAGGEARTVGDCGRA